MIEEDAPTIVCYKKGSQFVFKCKMCGKKHYHGAVEGHRQSHCLKENAYPKGYILVKE